MVQTVPQEADGERERDDDDVSALMVVLAYTWFRNRGVGWSYECIDVNVRSSHAVALTLTDVLQNHL